MKFKWIVIVAFILVAVSLFMFFPKKDKNIPQNLMGEWTSSDPRYQDRFFKITRERVTFGLGGDKEDTYFISSIEASPESHHTLYTISCKNADGASFTRSFYYQSANGGVITFKNQKHIEWHKENDHLGHSIDYTPSADLKG